MEINKKKTLEYDNCIAKIEIQLYGVIQWLLYADS